MIEPVAPFTLLAPYSTIANMAITADSAKVAGKSFCHSINDNAATAAAITPIATAIAIIEPLQSSAPSVAVIIPDMNVAKNPIATIPFASAPSDIIPNNIHTPAIIAKETLNATSVSPTFAICLSPYFDNTLTIQVTNTPKAIMKTIPAPI